MNGTRAAEAMQFIISDREPIVQTVLLSPDGSLGSRIAWNAIATGAASMARMLATVLLARILGPAEMGRFTFAAWVVEMVVLGLGLGVPNAISRHLALGGVHSSLAPMRRTLAFWGLFATASGTALVFVLGIAWVAPASSWWLSAALAAMLFCQLWAGVGQAVLLGLQRFRSLTETAVAGGLCGLAAAGAGSAICGLGGAIVGTALGSATSAILALHLARDARKVPVPTELPRVTPTGSFWNYALNTWGAALISAVVWGRTELFFLERLASHVQVAYFGVGLLFSSLTVQLLQLFTGGLMPHFASLVGRSDYRSLCRDYSRLTIMAAAMAYPVSVFSIALMPELLVLVFGWDYAGALGTGRWLATSGLMAFATVGSATVYGLGDAALIRRWSTVGAVLMIVGCWVLVPLYGAAGAAAARFGVQAAMVTIGSLILRYQYGLPFPAGRLARLLGAAVSSGVLARVAAIIVGGGWPGLLAGMAAGGFTYLLALRMVGALDADIATDLLRATVRVPRPFGRLCRALVHFLAPARS